MNTLQTIRHNLCISQEQLGNYISRSRSFIAMNEAEKKTLPVKNWVKLLRLNSLYEQVAATHRAEDSITISFPLPNNDPSILLTHLKSCNNKKEKLETKLRDMQDNYRHCVDICTVISLLKNDLPDGKEKKKDRCWLDALQADIYVKLFDCSPVLQQVLQLQIAALQFEITTGLAMAGVESLADAVTAPSGDSKSPDG